MGANEVGLPSVRVIEDRASDVTVDAPGLIAATFSRRRGDTIIWGLDRPGRTIHQLAHLFEICPTLADNPRLSQEMCFMLKTRAPFAPEFRRQLVELVRAGRKPDGLARIFGPPAQSIRNWVAREGKKQDGGDEKNSTAPADHNELIRLRRELRQLRQERDILSKVAARFARESYTMPSGSSGS